MNISIKARARLTYLQAATAVNRTSNKAVEGLATFAQNRIADGLKSLDEKQDKANDLRSKEITRLRSAFKQQREGLRRVRDTMDEAIAASYTDEAVALQEANDKIKI